MLILVGCQDTKAPNKKNDPPVNSSISITPYVIFSDNAVANTGIAWDSKYNQLVHSKYNFHDNTYKLLFTTMNVVPVKEVDLTPLIDYIQGVSYNPHHDSFYVWATKKGYYPDPFTNSFVLVEVTREGRLLHKYELPSEFSYPGTAAYLSPNRLWVKGNTQSMAYLYNLKARKVLYEVDTGIHGEGIAITRSGNLWVHGDCVVRLLTPEGITLKEFPSPTLYCEEEALVVDGEGNLWISVNEGSHRDIPNGNKVWKVTFE